MRVKFLLHISLLFALACSTGYEHNIKGMVLRKFCLNIAETEKRNHIKIGNGSLTINENMTFTVTNDSLYFSNITGKWDLCCKASDWGNYIFIPDGHIRQMSSTPEFEVKIQGKIYFMIFTASD